MTLDPPPVLDDELILLARAELLGFLALACADPRAARWPGLLDRDRQERAQAAAAVLAAEGRVPDPLAPGERSPRGLDLDLLVAALRERPRGRWVELHDRLFGLVSSDDCPPYETRYCPQTFVVARTERMADVAGFYHAFGVRPGRDAPERPDHVALELEFLAWLVAKQRLAADLGGERAAECAATCRDAQRAFVEEHLAWWVPAFAHALERRAGQVLGPEAGAHRGLADALARVVPLERALLEVGPPRELARPADDAQPEACRGCAGG